MQQSLTKIVLALFAVSTALSWPYPQSSAAMAEANLAAEVSTLNAFGNELLALDKKCAELDKKATISRADFDSVRSNADRLKQRTSAIQQAFRSIIDKLKAAKEWDNFDASALQKSKKERIQNFLRSEGGARRVLENIAAQVGSLSSEIDTPVERLRSKVREQTGSIGFDDARSLSGPLVRASFVATGSIAAPAAFSRVKCGFAKARSFLSGLVNGGIPSSDAINAECKACGVAFEDCANPNLN